MASASDRFSKLNSIVAAILRSPLHWPLSIGLALITVTGRRSGRQYTLPVGYQRRGDEILILVSDAPNKIWWRNYRTPGPMALLVRGTSMKGTAELIEPNHPAFRDLCEYTIRRVPGLGRTFGIEFDRAAGLSDAQVEHLGREVAAIRVTIEP
jgi:hypothetical protein